MKILDRYILKQFVINFVTAFFILIFIFIFQTIWLFIDDLAGKGIDIIIILKFIVYHIPGLIPLVLPLTVLLASILTFGNLAEHYEFAAMKASGISLKRAMRPLVVFMLLLSIVTFFVNNNLIPAAELTSMNMRVNIKKAKPALAITEGVFTDLGEMNIKVVDKYGENDRFLRDVTIHLKSSNKKNLKVIKSNKGELLSSESSNILQLILRDGYYYEDVQSKDIRKRDNYLNAKAYFEEYTINVDISGFNNSSEDIEEQRHTNTFKMMRVNELDEAIDSITGNYKTNMTEFGKNLYRRTGYNGLDTNVKLKDSAKSTPAKHITSVVELVPSDIKKKQILDVAINAVSNSINTLKGKKADTSLRKKILNKHIITYHNKFSLSVACIVLFFVGAPLGAIIRKGGLGLPIIVSMLIFLAYHFLGMFVSNFSEDGSLKPSFAAWIPTLVMLPLGIYFTYRATTDQPLTDFDRITVPITNFFKRIFGKKK